MNAWQSSWLYRVWVVGGLIGVVAFAVVGGMSDPSDQGFILVLIPVIAVWMAGIFVLQWRALRRDERDRPEELGPLSGLLRWNIVFGALLCLAIFAGVYLFYADVGGVAHPLGASGPGLPVALIPAVVLVLYGALRTLNVMRELGRGGTADPGGPTDFEGPTDIQAPPDPIRRGRRGA